MFLSLPDYNILVTPGASASNINLLFRTRGRMRSRAVISDQQPDDRDVSVLICENNPGYILLLTECAPWIKI